MRLIRSCTVGLVVSLSFSASATAGVGGGLDPESGTATVTAGSPPVVRTGTASLCTWNRLTNRAAANMDALGNQEITDPLDPFWEQWFTNVINGITVHGYTVSCPEATIGFRWVDPRVSISVLIPPLLDAASELIATPETEINPPVPAGGYVNLGLWLAVTPRTYPPLSAEAGPAVWITAIPTLTSTTFDLGDGSPPVTCEGAGTPIGDLDDPGEGPCGATYRQPGTYTVTITSEWHFPYQSSEGPGTFGPLLRTSTYTYEVREIQTVGTRG